MVPVVAKMRRLRMEKARSQDERNWLAQRTCSGPHIDTPGSTCVRCFFGAKLCFFINECDMNDSDWDGLQAAGYQWQPSDKAHYL